VGSYNSWNIPGSSKSPALRFGKERSMKIKLPQFPPKPLPPLFPEQEIDIPDFPKPNSVTVGIPPSVSVSFDIRQRDS
jgi:hypothetical protein